MTPKCIRLPALGHFMLQLTVAACVCQALQESGKYITKDPHAATLFLVPALLYCIRGSKNLTYSGSPGLEPNQPISLSGLG